ncbi:MAG: beta-lactamase family protein [Verrucomicrobia bacterium]|nr:beta-lactamase family protein [Verrucomicrobiota bacterium]
MKFISRLAAVWLSLALTAAVFAADAAKLAAIPPAIQKFVDDETIAGAVTLVSHKGKVVALDTVGYADLAAKRPMKADNLFWIASMTKPITAVSVLMLQEEGKLSVDDPVERFLPEFKGQMIFGARTNNQLILKKPGRPITLHDLLTHTSGLNVEIPDLNRELTLAERVLYYSQQPLQFEPGSKWQYSNPGINTLGRIVEIVAKKPYAQFLEERLFQPLGMKETTFWPSTAQVHRLAKSYGPGPGNKGLVETNVWFIRGSLSDRTRPALPAGGLFSTASDIAKFYQMMLHGGKADGKLLLKTETVALMTTTQSGDIKTGFVDGMSWGLGFQVVKEPLGVNAPLSPGTFGHGGAYGTQSWGDPQTQAIYILMIQRARLGNSDGSDLRKTFQETAAGAVR